MNTTAATGVTARRLPTALVLAGAALAALAIAAFSSERGPRPGATPAADARRPAPEPGQFMLPTRIAFNGHAISELSGLAWDRDQGLLYAVSRRGVLFQFRLRFDDDALIACEPIFATRLAGSIVASALALRHADNGRVGDSELLIAVAGATPHVLRVRPDGRILGTAAALTRDRAAAIAYDSARGLITVAGDAGGEAAPALDVLADGRVVALESTREAKFVGTSLAAVNLDHCDRGYCPRDVLRVLPASDHAFAAMSVIDQRHILLASDDRGRGVTLFLLITLPPVDGSRT